MAGRLIVIGVLIGSLLANVTTRTGVAADQGNHEMWVYVGTYTRGTKSEGIYIFRMDLTTGAMKLAGTAQGVDNPSFLAIHPSGKFVYSVGDVADSSGKRVGVVAAYARDTKSGQLTLLNHQPSEGSGPCHVSVDRAGSTVMVANYGSGSVASYPLEGSGRVGKSASAIQHHGSSVNPKRQEGPHAHSINVDFGNRFAVAADLGLDQVLIYRLDPKQGTLTPNRPASVRVAPGAGPRHFAFHPSGKFAYVINEINCTVTAFDFDGDEGSLREIQTVATLPHPVRDGDSTAEVQVHPSGRFLYGSNRGHDTIAIFTIDPKSGKLTPVGHEPTGGKTPRNFGLDPTGQFLLAANQATDNLVVFRIDLDSGKLSRTLHELQIPAPVCVKMIAVEE